MLTRSVWIEVTVGLALLAATLPAWAGGSYSTPAVLGQVGMFLALVLVAIEARGGFAVLAGAVVLTLILDPTGRGTTAYFLVCAIFSYVTRSRWPSASGATALLGLAVIPTVLKYTNGEQVIGSVVATVLLAALGWALGLGFRSVRKSTEGRAARRHQQQLLELASNLHGDATRNLAVAVMQLESIKAEYSSWTPELDQVLERVRSTNRSLRDVTAALHGQPSLATATPDVAAALTRGLADLRLAGFTVVTDPPEISADIWAQISNIDTAASSMITEALHNAAKHGDPDHPCHVTVTTSEAGIQIAITNHIASTEPRGGSGMGLPTMQQHALVAGGQVRSVPMGEVWSCSIMLPVTARQEAR